MCIVTRATAVVAVMMALGAAGCAIGGKYVLETRLVPTRQPDTSFVYGYLDMQEAQDGMQWAYLKQMEPPVFDPDFKMRASQGVFYLENLPKGGFRLDGFGGNGWSPFRGNALIARHATDYVLRMDSPIQFEIKRPGVYYVGAYRFVFKPGKGGQEDSFALEKVAQPTEREVLAKIIQQAKGSAWEPVLQAHLNRL